MGGWVGGWVAGNCETITNSASAEARVEALAELGKMASIFLGHPVPGNEHVPKI